MFLIFNLSFFFFFFFLHFDFSSSASPQKPIGFGTSVTGGGNAKPAAPPNIQILKTWLSDPTPRVILIDKLFDFTDSEGNTTGPGCAVWPECKNGGKVQVAIDFRGWCGQQKGAKRITVNHRKAAITPLVIGSNKSLLGVGAKGVIKGKGVVINKPSKNNIAITYLNPFAVWGGDAITLNGATDVNIYINIQVLIQRFGFDHCTISLIGRQMLSSGGNFPNAGITVSANHFVGKTPWSTDCRGQHYWTIILGGQGDQMTLADNCFMSTGGRSPKLGVGTNSKVFVHSFNNYHSGTRGQAVEVSHGGTMIIEGDVFEDSGPANPGQASAQVGGALFAPFTPQEAQSCQASLGRACLPSITIKPPSGASFKFAANAAALNGARSFPAVKGARVQPAASVSQRKMSQCGVGKIS
ncbi:family 1 polysaccharide lyase [Melampsora americana]|nr:family 1 polysaccharide lyase [Melampsora americana]